jgi:hypothetical protein
MAARPLFGFCARLAVRNGLGRCPLCYVGATQPSFRHPGPGGPHGRVSREPRHLVAILGVAAKFLNGIDVSASWHLKL